MAGSVSVRCATSYSVIVSPMTTSSMRCAASDALHFNLARRIAEFDSAEALHREEVPYCGEIGCVIALQEHSPQCQILSLSHSGAQDVPPERCFGVT